MENVIIGINEAAYKDTCESIADARSVIEGLKPLFIEQDLPYNLENIRDLLQGAQNVEKFLFERLDKDLQGINTPGLKKKHRESVQESLWAFLNKIRDAVKHKNIGSRIIDPAKALNHFHLFVVKDETLFLYKGWKEAIKEEYVIYATPEQIKLFNALEKVCKNLNEARKLWTFTPKMPLDVVFKEEKGKFIVNKQYERDYVSKVQNFQKLVQASEK